MTENDFRLLTAELISPKTLIIFVAAIYLLKRKVFKDLSIKWLIIIRGGGKSDKKVD